MWIQTQEGLLVNLDRIDYIEDEPTADGKGRQIIAHGERMLALGVYPSKAAVNETMKTIYTRLRDGFAVMAL